MTCKCVETVNLLLAGRNTRLSQAIMLIEHDHDALMLETEQVETGRGKPKACSMFLTYCPFCGRKYSEEAQVTSASTHESDESGSIPIIDRKDVDGNHLKVTVDRRIAALLSKGRANGKGELA